MCPCFEGKALFFSFLKVQHQPLTFALNGRFFCLGCYCKVEDYPLPILVWWPELFQADLSDTGCCPVCFHVLVIFLLLVVFWSCGPFSFVIISPPTAVSTFYDGCQLLLAALLSAPLVTVDILRTDCKHDCRLQQSNSLKGRLHSKINK